MSRHKNYMLNLDNMDAIDVYNLVLNGTISRFPRGFWHDKNNQAKCTKYLFENILKWNDEDIKKNITHKTFQTNKLGGMLCNYCGNSPFVAIENAYPGRFKPWEFGMSNWTKEMAQEATKWLIEDVLKLEENEIPKQNWVDLFKANRLYAMLRVVYKDCVYNAINDVYPNKYNPWDFNSVPVGYWTKETTAKATRWLIEKKLKLNDEELKQKITAKSFKENNLGGMLYTCFNNSPFAAIENAYPGRFKPWEFGMCPLGYWTDEHIVEAIKWLVEEKLGLTANNVSNSRKINRGVFADYGLGGMLALKFKSSYKRAINFVYPNTYLV